MEKSIKHAIVTIMAELGVRSVSVGPIHATISDDGDLIHSGSDNSRTLVRVILGKVLGDSHE